MSGNGACLSPAITNCLSSIYGNGGFFKPSYLNAGFQSFITAYSRGEIPFTTAGRTP